MTVEGKAGTTPRDRFAEWLVIALVLVALLVGWGIKSGAESLAVEIRVQDFQARYGYNWIRKEAKASDLLEIADPGSGGRIPTTITVKELEETGSNVEVAQLLNRCGWVKRSFTAPSKARRSIGVGDRPTATISPTSMSPPICSVPQCRWFCTVPITSFPTDRGHT